MHDLEIGNHLEIWGYRGWEDKALDDFWPELVEEPEEDDEEEYDD